MLQVNVSKLRNLSIRLNHNHSGECGNYTWNVIDWYENKEYCNKYDYKVEFKEKINGKLMGSLMFYGADADGKSLMGKINRFIYCFSRQNLRIVKTTQQNETK